MFFYASKIAWYVLQPSSMLLVLFLAGLALHWFGRRRVAIQVLALAVAIYAIGGLTPLANAVLWSLESRYPRPAIDELNRLDGIIVLGGVVDTLVAQDGGEIPLNE